MHIPRSVAATPAQPNEVRNTTLFIPHSIRIPHKTRADPRGYACLFLLTIPHRNISSSLLKIHMTII